jgi:mannose-6-phosphate isomerase-like protein (cupin superfamily)
MSYGLQGKVWGETKELLNTPLIEVHEIWIKPNMQCSMHKHEFKWNMFYVMEGQLAIDVQKNDYDLQDTTILDDGQWCSVRPNEFHRFRTLDVPVRALEIYYLEPLCADIVRKDVGGFIGEEE